MKIEGADIPSPTRAAPARAQVQALVGYRVRVGGSRCPIRAKREAPLFPEVGAPPIPAFPHKRGRRTPSTRSTQSTSELVDKIDSLPNRRRRRRRPHRPRRPVSHVPERGGATFVDGDQKAAFLRQVHESRGVDTDLPASTGGVPTSATILPIRANGERLALHNRGASNALPRACRPVRRSQAAVDAAGDQPCRPKRRRYGRRTERRRGGRPAAQTRMNALTAGSEASASRSAALGNCGRSRALATTQKKPSGSSPVARN